LSNTIRSNCQTGILCGGEASATISGNTIIRNQGGISCDSGSFVITDNVISGNHMNDWGGGGITLCGSYCSATVSGNTISGNRAEDGGGILCYYTISAGIRKDGNGDSNVVAGLAMSQEAPIIIANNQIIGNSATRGGAIYVTYSIPMSITNNTIAANYAEEGGGILCGEYPGFGSVTILDCILWGNGDDLSGCSATYCCVEDDDPGEGNIHEDPQFVIGPFGDYYLHPDSLCIDAGSRPAAEAGLDTMTTQVDGTPDTGIVDIGFHYRLP
jgi:predicted outer membrane repeat protein